jgi:hypothetical protein
VSKRGGMGLIRLMKTKKERKVGRKSHHKIDEGQRGEKSRLKESS